jgi:hypothetical protein
LPRYTGSAGLKENEVARKRELTKGFSSQTSGKDLFFPCSRNLVRLLIAESQPAGHII